MTSQQKAAQDALSNFCAATLEHLADACRNAAIDGNFDTLQGLALHSLFLGLSQRIGHGPTSRSSVDALKVQWAPILQSLTEHAGSQPLPDLSDLLSERRHLIR